MMYTPLASTLTLRFWPRTAAWLRNLGLILAGTLFTALLAQARLPLPFTPVPLTGQTFAVLLTGAALGSRRGLISMTLYLLLGGLGLPFFAGGQGGWAYLTGPTLGYLIGFVAAAWGVGRLAERGLERRLRTAWLPFLAGTLIIYICGAGWLALSLGVRRALLLGVLPFLAGDLLKIALAALTLPAAWNVVKLSERPADEN
ncbi:MAG: biotin transporter BioY [Candidatus Villigracilaceae bacterium]